MHRLAAALLLFVAFAGCDDDGPAARPCASDESCRINELCVDGACAPFDAVDGDGDGLPDAIEALVGSDPAVGDTDGDGELDGAEVWWTVGSRLYMAADADEDGRPDVLESARVDRDGDGLVDERDPCDDDADCPVPRPDMRPCRAEEGAACVAGLGLCAGAGVTVCAEDGVGVVCVGEVGEPGDEACNGLDDDCDGAADEDWPALGTVCAAGEGGCRVEAAVVCAADGARTMCPAVAGAPRGERCDGVDDDCDGGVD